MHDALHAVDRLLDLAHDREIGLDKPLIRLKAGRSLQIAPADIRIDALEERAKTAADAACSSGDQDFVHVRPLCVAYASLGFDPVVLIMSSTHKQPRKLIPRSAKMCA